MCTCIPEPLSPKIGFGIKVADLPWRRATFFTMYLNHISLSATSTMVSIAEIDFTLAGAGHFVMLAFDFDAELFQLQADFGAHIMVRVDWEAPESNPLSRAVCNPGCCRFRRGRSSRSLRRNQLGRSRRKRV